MSERTLSERLRSFGVLTHGELIELQLLEARLEALERENRALRANTSKSVLRRLDTQLAAAREEK